DPYEHLNVALNPDGTLTRFIQLPTTPPTGEDPTTPGLTVLSKDVTLNADKKTWIRLYRPANVPPAARLPIVFYLHSGGWVMMSVAETYLHESNNRLAAELPAVTISVEYRLAPEHRLPAQYDDAIEAVHWLRQQAADEENGERWIRDYGDFSRCYLYGISCGANIAFNVALRLEENLEPIRFAGTILNQPMFGGKQRTKSELKMAADQFFPLPVLDLLWELALPAGTDRDHRYCNPFVDKPMREKLRKLGRCLIIGFGGDLLIDRQQDFVQMLVENGVLVEARFDDVGFHMIDMIDPRRATAILTFIKEFV
ncbi:hypothetical protein M569_14952, partial [Genlisea aurea]